MNSGTEHSFAAYMVFVGLSSFIYFGFFVLLLNIKTFWQWSVELLRLLMGLVLILVGVAIRDTFYLVESVAQLVESVAQKVKRIGHKVNIIGLDIYSDHRKRGAF